MSDTSISTDFDIRPVAGRIGAEIVGVDLTADLDDTVIAEIRAALLQWKVVFFRGQQALGPDGHVRFAARFGELTTAHPTVPSLPDQPNILDLDYSRSPSRANNWHTDVTFVDRPPLGSVLRAVVIPPYGGDTVWANSVTAYADLPVHLRALADTLRAVHTNVHDYATAQKFSPEQRKAADVFASQAFETEHPVVRVHPETGEQGLYIGGFARTITGLSSAESTDLLRILQSYVTTPENTVRWRWQPGDVAFWDNRATQHYAVADYGDLPRRVQRITLAGDVPVGADGRESTSLRGDSTHYTPAH